MSRQSRNQGLEIEKGTKRLLDNARENKSRGGEFGVDGGRHHDKGNQWLWFWS